MTDQPHTDNDLEPTYWWRNSCGDEVDDEAAECCDDGEIEPSYDPPAAPTARRPDQPTDHTENSR